MISRGTKKGSGFRVQGLAFVSAACLLLSPYLPLALAKDAQFDQAESLKSKRKLDEAIVLYQAVIARADAEPDNKVRSKWAIIDCLRQQKKYEASLAEAIQLHDSLASDHFMKRQAAGAVCDLLSQLNRHDEAAAVAAQTAQAAADEREVAAEWRMRCANLLIRAKKYPEAYEQGAKALAAAKETEEHRRVLDALWLQADAMYLAQDYARCLVPLKQSLELKFEDIPDNAWLCFKQRIGDCHTKLNALPEVRAAYKTFLATESDAPQRQRWWLGIAATWETEKNAAEAIAAYDQVIADRADLLCRDHWQEAQSAILRLAMQDADSTAALKLQHLSMDLADTRERIQPAAMQILNLLRKADGNATRAKAFAAYQQFGRAGPDANLGTSDDLADPLESIGYPANPARVTAFEAASAKLGSDAQASLHRGWMCLYIGRPKEATSWFLDACRRGAGDEYQSAVHALVFCSARAATGSISDVERLADFILHGPVGLDGKSPVADPFATLAAPPGLPEPALAETDRTNLLEVEKRLAAGLDQGLWQPEMKPDVIASLDRVHGGLGDWNTPGLADWYFTRMKSEPVAKTQESMLPGALAAARAGQIHMAGMRQFLTRLEGEEGSKPIVRETTRKAWAVWMQKIETQSRSKTLVPRMKVN